MKHVAVIALFGCLIVTGCAASRPTHPPVPPYETEQIPLPPVSAAVVVWQPGHFDWNGTDYTWKPGEWVERVNTTWLDGYWDETTRNPVWVPAHWL